jgi:steroid delta-isomerase-like uncharacterized protein
MQQIIRKDETMSAEQDIATIREAFDQFINKRNVANAEKYLTPDYVGHFTGAPPIKGVDAFKQYLGMWYAGMSDMHVDIEDVIADGERVALRLTYHAKHTGNLNGIPATGKSTTVSSINIFRMQNGKAVEQWANNDDLGMLQQLGVIPMMQSA